MEYPTFEAYLKSKKIDAVRFEAAEKQRFDELKKLFEASHPDSFTMQKMFIINPLRRKYHDGVLGKAN